MLSGESRLPWLHPRCMLLLMFTWEERVVLKGCMSGKRKVDVTCRSFRREQRTQVYARRTRHKHASTRISSLGEGTCCAPSREEISGHSENRLTNPSCRLTLPLRLFLSPADYSYDSPTMRCDVLTTAVRLKRQLESARGIIKVVANGETSDGAGGTKKRLRVGGAGGLESGASHVSGLTRYSSACSCSVGDEGRESCSTQHRYIAPWFVRSSRFQRDTYSGV